MKSIGERISPNFPKRYCFFDSQLVDYGLTCECRFYDEKHGCLIAAFLNRKGTTVIQLHT